MTLLGTERLVLDSSSNHVGKLSGLGVRIASVAHELNSPLSMITGSLDLLGKYVDALAHYAEAAGGSRSRSELQRLHEQLRIDYVVANVLPLLDICREGGERLGYLIQQLRLYGRRDGDIDSQAIQVADLMVDVVREACAGRSPDARVQVDPVDARVHGEPVALQRAFVNLITNGLDAVAGVPKGRVWFTASVDDSTQQIRISVQDNGPGVQAELRGRIFEPFFSTKPGSSGMGLGLAIVREIIESHHGTVHLCDTPVGAHFLTTLPRVD